MSKKLIVPVAILFGGLLIASGILISANLFGIKSAVASQNPEWTQTAGAGISVPACGSASLDLPTCSGSSPSVTISWTWTINAAHTMECNLVNVGIYKDGVQVQGYQRACNDSITWTGGESGTVYTYNVYFLLMDGMGALDIKSGSFTTPNCGSTISLRATLDSAPWTGRITYDVSSPLGSGTDITRIVPLDLPGGPVGDYAYTYKSGGPPGATFVNITPSASQTLSEGGTITFTFNFVSPPPINYTLTTSVNPPGSGTITSGPPGISCPGDCSETYTSGTWVTLIATPDTAAGYADGTWSGSCSGSSASPCSLFIDSDKTAGVNFNVAPPPTVSLTASPNPVAYGSPSTLTWSSTNATACTASGAWSGAKAISGSQSTGAMTVDQTFIIDCTGPGGTDSDSVTVLVTALPSFNYTLSNSGTSNVIKTGGDAFTTNTIIKTLLAGTTQPVTLSLSGVPAGVSYSISSSACSPTCTSVVTFTVPSSTPVGTYPITVTGSPLDKQTNFNLVVSGSPFTVSCSASPSPALLGQTVTWTAVVSGGIPPLTYLWSGTNIPTSPAPNTNPFSIIYSTIGQKTATVMVTDTDSVSANCPAGTVRINFDPDFEEF